MHRRALIALLERYAAAWPAERDVAARFVAFVRAHDDCLERTCAPGHVTASAWITGAGGERALLTHHRKLGRWLQLGGHVDGEQHVERAALREAHEESGLPALELVRWSPELVPLDLDVHPIPARGTEPRHDHWDVRFWLQADADAQLVLSAESVDLRWFATQQLAAVTDEDSVLRLARKVAALRGRTRGR